MFVLHWKISKGLPCRPLLSMTDDTVCEGDIAAVENDYALK